MTSLTEVKDDSEFADARGLLKKLFLNGDAMQEDQLEAKIQTVRATARDIRKMTNGMQQLGFISSEVEGEYWVNRLLCFGRDDHQSVRNRELRAWHRTVTGKVLSFIEARHAAHGGDSNITIEIRGRTGTGKSGMALSVAKHLGLAPDNVRDSVHFNARPFLTATQRNITRRAEKKPYSPVQILDESNLPVGEGATTTQHLLENYEGRLREGGVSMIFNRPNVEDPPTRDLTLEMVGVSHEHRAYCAIAYHRDAPLGIVTMPWPDEPLWIPYQQIKKEALQGTGNPESENIRREALEMLTDEALMEMLHPFASEDARIELEVHERIMSGMSVNSSRRLVALIKRGANVWNDREAFTTFASSFANPTIPYGVDPEIVEVLEAWMTGNVDARRSSN